MIAFDRRTAPVPIYTPRSPSPSSKTKVSIVVDDQKAPRTIVTALQEFPKTTTRHRAASVRKHVLYPADAYEELAPNVKALSASQLALALKQLAKSKLPETASVFPWLHGIHKDNLTQQQYFNRMQGTLCLPPATFRSITIVHVTEDLPDSCGRLVNSLLPEDILEAETNAKDSLPRFKQVDTPHGWNIRHFKSQAVKVASLSDIVVYDHRSKRNHSEEALKVAQRIVKAQELFREESFGILPEFNTFVITDPFSVFEEQFPDLVASRIDGTETKNDPDFLDLEQEQMRLMSKAAEISQNVFLGNTQDWIDDSSYSDDGDPAPEQYNIHIMCEDCAPMPSLANNSIQDSGNPDHVIEILFPSSRSLRHPTEEQTKDLVDFCSWIHRQACETRADDLDWSLADLKDTRSHYIPQASSTMVDDDDDDVFGLCDGVIDPSSQATVPPEETKPRKVLITCKDGYTETTLLALAYTIYAECLTIDEAWVHLHRNKKREFYAFPEDLSALKIVARALIAASPRPAAKRADTMTRQAAPWFSSGDEYGINFAGSFPSRIMDHLYLGNLEHANNVQMLAAIGVQRILSIGEKVRFTTWAGRTDPKPLAHLFIDQIQDDGIDSLTRRLDQCLKFIDDGLKAGQATLVHCRVGVSRSASVCIAEVVRRLNYSVEDAYLFVRARRLNVIIQPNLRFMYELLKWSQEEQSRAAGLDMDNGELQPRSIEWATLASKIARLNAHYIRG